MASDDERTRVAIYSDLSGTDVAWGMGEDDAEATEAAKAKLRASLKGELEWDHPRDVGLSLRLEAGPTLKRSAAPPPKPSPEYTLATAIMAVSEEFRSDWHDRDVLEIVLDAARKQLVQEGGE